MTNYEFLRKYMALQYGIMYDDIIDYKFATIGYCEDDPSSFWNLALVNKLLTIKQIQTIEGKLTDLHRKPAVYFEGRSSLKSLEEFLKKRGYKKANEDSWMFYKFTDLKMVSQGHSESIKRVAGGDDLQAFLKTFDACYQKGDPQNPYDELGDYLKVAEDRWRKFFNVRPLDYFLVYKGDKPVAVSTLTSFEGIGYISNVGSLREVRGEGYGKAATLHAVVESVKRGNSEHCLATEEGTYPNEFYKQIGFKTRFVAPLFTKE